MGLLDAGINALGGIAQSVISADAARKATDKQIRWERERATNAHQWEVEDLKKAGLNPILSASGQGASTGGISAPVPDMSGITTGLNNALQAIAIKKDNELKDAQITNTETNSAAQTAATQKTVQETITEMRKQGLISAQTERELAESSLKQTQREQARLELTKQVRTLETQIEQMKTDLETAKHNKETAKQTALQEQINTKYKKWEKLVGLVEKLAYAYGSVAVGTSSVGRTAAELIPVKRVVGFAQNLIKKR